MAKERFIDWVPSGSSQEVIQWANAIIEQYRRQGYVLTIRQLYYQGVSRDLIPNNERSYKRIIDLMTKGRMAGYVDWSAIEDRGREHVLPPHWDNPAEIIRSAANSFRIDKWIDQPNHVEVMVEKTALEGILLPVCRRLDVGFTANRGYSSVSALKEAADRMRVAANQGREIHVLYLGDHDPSGLDMSRDVRDRLSVFLGHEFFEEGVRYVNEDLEDEVFDVDRLALNMDQVEQYNPPENPAKLTDSRAAGYIERFGNSSWELDALEPTVLDALVTDAVEALRDEDLWEQSVAQEEEGRQELSGYADQYEEEHA